MGQVQGPQDASFPFMNFSMVSLVNVVRADPAVAHVLAYTGNGNGGFMFMALKPLSTQWGTQCKEGPDWGATDLGGGRDQPPAAKNESPAGRFGVFAGCSGPAHRDAAAPRFINTPIQSDNIDDLAHWLRFFTKTCKKLPDLTDVNTTGRNGGLQELLNYDRRDRGAMGQTPAVARHALWQRILPIGSVSDLHAAEPVFNVVMEVAPHTAGSVGSELTSFRAARRFFGGRRP